MITRRGFLLGSGAAALLVACSDDGSPTVDDRTTTTGTSGSDATATTAAAAGLVLGEAFDRNDMLVAGIEQRAPYVLFEETGGLVRFAEAPATIGFTFALEGGEELPTVITDRHGEDVERPYYPLAITFPEPGTWAVRADLGDGRVLESLVQVNADVPIPQVGEPIPVLVTPTVSEPGGVATVCTREPACPFHDVSLDAAVAAGRPVAVLLSTPAYCQIGICGPVLDLLMAEAPNHPDLAVVHIEVYPNGGPPGAPPSDLVTTGFSLPYEPVLFVADATGAITARIDNIYDGPELAEALSTV